MARGRAIRERRANQALCQLGIEIRYRDNEDGADDSANLFALSPKTKGKIRSFPASKNGSNRTRKSPRPVRVRRFALGSA
jgi:hypothetical protein